MSEAASARPPARAAPSRNVARSTSLSIFLVLIELIGFFSSIALLVNQIRCRRFR